MDDGDEDKETPAHVIQSNKTEDESNLEARFYRYGVRSEWLQIHRILRHRSETHALGYDQSVNTQRCFFLFSRSSHL